MAVADVTVAFSRETVGHEAAEIIGQPYERFFPAEPTGTLVLT